MEGSDKVYLFEEEVKWLQLSKTGIRNIQPTQQRDEFEIELLEFVIIVIRLTQSGYLILNGKDAMIQDQNQNQSRLDVKNKVLENIGKYFENLDTLLHFLSPLYTISFNSLLNDKLMQHLNEEEDDENEDKDQ